MSDNVSNEQQKKEIWEAVEKGRLDDVRRLFAVVPKTVFIVLNPGWSVSALLSQKEEITY
jgi:hypothetical protein